MQLQLVSGDRDYARPVCRAACKMACRSAMVLYCAGVMGLARSQVLAGQDVAFCSATGGPMFCVRNAFILHDRPFRRMLAAASELFIWFGFMRTDGNRTTTDCRAKLEEFSAEIVGHSWSILVYRLEQFPKN